MTGSSAYPGSEPAVQLHHAKRDWADSLLEGTDTAHTLTADELIDLL